MGGEWTRALVLILLFAAIVLLVERLVGGLLVGRASGREVNRRLDAIAHGASRGEASAMLRRHVSTMPDLPPMLARPALAFERMLMAAKIAIPAGRLLIGLIAVPLALLALMMLALVATHQLLGVGRLFLLAVAAIAIGAGLPLFWLQLRANNQRKMFIEQFPVALDVFVRGLRAGHPVAAALDLLTTEMPDPIGSEFGLVSDEVTYGADLREALMAMADRWDVSDVRMFVVSLSVQSETGGNLAEILENLSRVIRERAGLMLKVRALSSEGRITALMLTILPVLTFVSLFLLNPPFYLDVADDPIFMPGFAILLGLYATGFYIIRRMVDLKV